MADVFVTECKKTLRGRLCLQKGITSEGDYFNEEIEENLRTIFTLLEGTVTRCEGNSLLLIGPRGTGKTWLLEKAFQKIDTVHKDKYIRVQLNGLVHTDDGIALKQIAAALTVENDFEETPNMSFATALNYLLDQMRSGDSLSRPVIFVLEEFDCFTQHHNQTLLYNLFDISQMAHTPIAVIGLTCRLDVIELLEKRVKSRFSHRQIHMFNNLNFTQYTELFKKLLSLPESVSDTSYHQKWQQHVEKLAEDRTMKEVLKRLYEKTKDIWSLKSLMVLPVSQLTAEETFLKSSHFQEASAVLHTNTKANIIADLSVLELTLLVAIRHHMEISSKPFNFEMIYKEYSKFTGQVAHSLEYTKQVVWRAFERLQSAGLVCPTEQRTTASSALPKEYRKMSLMLSCREVKEAVQTYPNCPTDLQQWSQKSGAA
ncbi:origin recognition complex subunit 4-like [Dysidea avara]|uniref:origin recognition complex subunit 4-like n=1 Tax=Dysidea avara TaxID=196820 RepID=UPI0033307192